MEWQEVLALRRVFYLENEVWERRKKELEETIENQQSSLYSRNSDNEGEEEEEEKDEHGLELNPLVHEEGENVVESNAPREGGLFHNLSFLLKYRKMEDEGKQNAPNIFSHLTAFQKRQERTAKLCAAKKRLKDPWVFDPEIRDTIPNIELYSVLVGNIPTLVSSTYLFHLRCPNLVKLSCAFPL